jgi:DNA-binding transcriptional LysR family regulator
VELTAHALRYFVTLAEELHFGRAAARLHLATPSLSEQIARLEQRVRTPLFVRDPRGVSLTAAGAELLPLARAAVGAHDAVGDWVAARQTAVRGTVRIAVLGASAAPVRAEVVGELAQRHPEVLLRTQRTGIEDAFDALLAGRVDVAYVPEPLPDLAGMRSAVVLVLPRLLVLPTGHALAGRTTVSIEETNGDVFVPIAARDEARTAWWLVDPRADGSSPARGPVAADVEELLDLCAAGRGIGVATEAARTHYTRPGITFVGLSDVPPASVAVCWRAEEREPAVLAYVAAARRWAVAT